MKRFFERNFKIVCMVTLILSFMVQPVSGSEYDDEKNTAQNQIYEAQKAIEDLQDKKADVNAYVKEIDKSIDQMNANLSSINNQISGKQQEIETSNILIAEKEAEIAQQHEDMKKRIKFMYENADTQYVEMILGSENFSDFLNKADFFSELTTYDRNMVLKMEETKTQLEAQKAQLEQEMADLEVLKADAIAQKSEAQTLMKEKENQMAVYDSQINLEQKEIEAQQAILAEISRLELSGENHYTGGIFVWPAPASQKITSHFGPRNTGIPGASTNHLGIDIGAGYGTNILAACSGTVVKAVNTLGNAAGKYIVLSHGDGLFTYYYHCSNVIVSEGQFVAAGTVIGYVGSTGISSGPHLHFGVSLDGKFKDPEPYLKG